MSKKNVPIYRAAGLNSEWAKGYTKFLEEKRRRKNARLNARQKKEMTVVDDKIGRSSDGKFVSLHRAPKYAKKRTGGGRRKRKVQSDSDSDSNSGSDSESD